MSTRILLFSALIVFSIKAEAKEYSVPSKLKICFGSMILLANTTFKIPPLPEPKLAALVTGSSLFSKSAEIIFEIKDHPTIQLLKGSKVAYAMTSLAKQLETDPMVKAQMRAESVISMEFDGIILRVTEGDQSHIHLRLIGRTREVDLFVAISRENFEKGLPIKVQLPTEERSAGVMSAKMGGEITLAYQPNSGIIKILKVAESIHVKSLFDQEDDNGELRNLEGVKNPQLQRKPLRN